MEPTRAGFSDARGSFVTVRRTGHKRLWITFRRGGLRGSMFSTRPAPSNAAAFRRSGACGRANLSRGHRPRTRASGCCAHRGHSDHGWVRFEAVGPLGQRRVAGGRDSHSLAPLAFDALVGSDVALVSTTGSNRIVLGAGGLSPTRRLAGSSKRAGFDRRSVGRLAPSTGRITPHCSRRTAPSPFGHGRTSPCTDHPRAQY